MDHTYPPALIKRAHVGEPGSGAEPGGHDHGGAVGGKHLETISIDTINREEQLSHNPSGYLPESHSESDKPCMALPCQYKGQVALEADQWCPAPQADRQGGSPPQLLGAVL